MEPYEPTDREIAKRKPGKNGSGGTGETMTTDNEQTTLEPCPWCAEGDKPKFLDADGTLVSITGNDGVMCHAYDDSWWPCMKFGVEMHCARVSADSVAPVVDHGERAKQLVDRWVIDRHLFPQQKPLTTHDIRILTEWIAAALDHAAAETVGEREDKENRDG